MKKAWLIAIIPGAIAMGMFAIVVALFAVKLLWAWTIPDIFPGAVKQGLIAGQISWLAAFKVALLVGVFAGIAGGASRKE